MLLHATSREISLIMRAQHLFPHFYGFREELVMWVSGQELHAPAIFYPRAKVMLSGLIQGQGHACDLLT